MSIGRNVVVFCLFIVFTLLVIPTVLFAQYESIHLYSIDPYADPCGIEFGCYPSGYSDGWYWGWTSRHKKYSHETLSGEWAAAIYYNGIHNNRDKFFEY